jgi:citrate synthase
MGVEDGLEGVVAGSTSICSIDNDVLTFRGIDIHELAENALYAEVVYLLFWGSLPNESKLKNFSGELIKHAKLNSEVWDLLKRFPTKSSPMEWLRTAVSALSFYDPDSMENSPEANLRKSIKLVGQMSTLVAGFHRLRMGQKLIEPERDQSLAWNFLYMLHGKKPEELFVKVFDTCLVLHADHELNASTFAARVTAATLSDMYSAITSAIGTLKGPLHGGANEQVMIMLEKISDPSQAKKFIESALQNKERIMGFGHRVYKNGDPRASHLKRFSELLGKKTGNLKWYEISTIVDEVVRQQKKLLPNVDFYSASTYHYLGIPTDLFTPVFACSRIAGWCAHVMEQLSHNRLIRPRAEYLGPRNQHYVPLDQRSL